ncbi:MAG TPA: hypothetical protein VF041_23105 [Gemmatimonadaceae bacterium]
MSETLLAALAGLGGAALTAVLGPTIAGRFKSRDDGARRYDAGVWRIVTEQRAEIKELRERLDTLEARSEAQTQENMDLRANLLQVQAGEREVRRDNERLRTRVAELEAQVRELKQEA